MIDIISSMGHLPLLKYITNLQADSKSLFLWISWSCGFPQNLRTPTNWCLISQNAKLFVVRWVSRICYMVNAKYGTDAHQISLIGSTGRANVWHHFKWSRVVQMQLKFHHISSLIQIRIRPEHRSDGFRLATWRCKAKTSCAWRARHCVDTVTDASQGGSPFHMPDAILHVAPASQRDVPARRGKLPCRRIYTASTSDDSIAFHWSLCILHGCHQFWCSRSSQLCSVAEVIRNSSNFAVLDGLFQTTLPKTPVFWWWSELTDPHSDPIRDTPHILCPSHISQEQWHPYPNHVSFNLIVSHLTISWYYVWSNNPFCDLPWWFSLSLNRTIWPCLTIMWNPQSILWLRIFGTISVGLG